MLYGGAKLLYLSIDESKSARVTVIFKGVCLKPFISQSDLKHIVEVNLADRWQIFRRLQELNIPSWCDSDQPLTVAIATPTTGIQLWSVVRHSTASRHDLIRTLEQCWDCANH
jgi:hypothetical protein